ncbi:MAG: ABC transporter substrate-binding protein [Alphaproteobacteria bacterium]|nr:MAG: ABC transporter substrate-binding protein [Alphaproteobacteria bacterium]
MVRTIFAAALIFFAPAAFAQSAPPDAVRELAPTGKLRAAINYGNGVLAQKGPDGAPRGVSADLSRELARRLGVPLEFITFTAAGKAFEAAKENKVDVLFVAIEPVRAADVAFTPPYVLIEGTYMVLKDSPLREPADVDRPGTRISVGENSAYDLYLTRTLKHATLLRTPGGCCKNIDLFRAEKLDAVAGVKQPLAEYAKQHSDVRVMEKSFQEIRQAMATPNGRAAGAAYLRAFIEEMKASGFVADALQRSNQPDARVAPAGG